MYFWTENPIKALFKLLCWGLSLGFKIKNWFWPTLRVILDHKSAKIISPKFTMFFTGVDCPISDIELSMVLGFIFLRFNATYI